MQAANTLTALPNGRYVNVRMERMRQGLELAQRGVVTLPEDGEELSAVVRSDITVYQVDTRLLTCTCADYQKHLQSTSICSPWRSHRRPGPRWPCRRPLTSGGGASQHPSLPPAAPAPPPGPSAKRQRRSTSSSRSATWNSCSCDLFRPN